MVFDWLRQGVRGGGREGEGEGERKREGCSLVLSTTFSDCDYTLDIWPWLLVWRCPWNNATSQSKHINKYLATVSMPLWISKTSTITYLIIFHFCRLTYDNTDCPNSRTHIFVDFYCSLITTLFSILAFPNNFCEFKLICNDNRYVLSSWRRHVLKITSFLIK